MQQKKCCPNFGSEIERSSDDDGPMASTRTTTKIDMIETIPEQGSSSSLVGSLDSMVLLGRVMGEMGIQKLSQLQTRARVEEDLSQVVTHQVSESIRPVRNKLQTIEQRISEAETIATTTSVRTLKLIFFDEVAGPVLTSKKIRSKEDKPIRVALIDEKTGDTVDSGLESSLRAEIVLLDANDDNDESNWTCEDFLSRLIKEGDKTMPHFSKTQYIDLNKGVADLDDLKLGHDKRWTKNSKCKLGVRLAANNNNIRGGVEVREGWTNSFTVCDSRGKLYQKGNPPCLSDPLWKLEMIGRNGDPLKRLKENKVERVKDFLFLHSVDPTSLQKIILGEKRKAEDSESWNAIVRHAKTSRIDNTNIYVHFPRSPESQSRGVVFDVVGGLKGLIDKSRFICVRDLLEDDKGVARELLKSAFGNKNDRMSFRDEASLLERFPHPPSDPSTSRLDFSTDEEDDTSQPMITHDFSHDSGSMLFYQQNPIHPVPNQNFGFNNVPLSHILQAGIRGQPLAGLSDRALLKRLTFSAADEHPLESTSLRLQFLNSISLPVFTGTRIQGRGRSSLEVALIDIHTGNIVTSGPGSSAEVEIVALEGDFDSWTLEDFDNNIVRERAGEKPLLDGDVKTTLENGKGLAGDIVFTDNSSWTRSRQFRLGARIVDDGTGRTARVREARSEPFTVRDHHRDVPGIQFVLVKRRGASSDGQFVPADSYLCEAEKEVARELPTSSNCPPHPSSSLPQTCPPPPPPGFMSKDSTCFPQTHPPPPLGFDDCLESRDHLFGEDSSDILISNEQLLYYFDATDSPFFSCSRFIRAGRSAEESVVSPFPAKLLLFFSPILWSVCK